MSNLSGRADDQPGAQGASCPAFIPHSAVRGHAQSTRDIDHVTQRDQSDAVFGRDRCGRAGDSGGAADRKKGIKLFEGQHLTF